ncbi:hypothetical protein IPM19_00940 [bacterium]|nr:MAG: hypothetical protein IPM19_00940 [bacterium]
MNSEINRIPGDVDAAISNETAQESKVEQNRDVIEFFNLPFADEEVAASWDSFSRLRESAIPPVKNLYTKDFENCSFKIDVKNFGDVEMICFYLQDKFGDKPAEFVFDKDHGASSSWNIQHRWIDSTNRIVSGTDFLKKVEDYMQKLDNLGYRRVTQYTEESAQPNVTKWLLKNGYEFTDKSSAEQYQNIIDHPDNYTLIKIDNGDDITKEEFIFQKSALEEEPLRSALANKNPDGSVSFRYKEMLKLPGFINLKLEKNLTQEPEIEA